jgi:hypothetical protein
MRWLSVTCLALGVIALVNIIFLSFIDAVSQQSRIAISYALGARFRRLVAQPSARFALFAIIGMAVGLLIDLELRRHIASFLQLTPDQIAFSTPQKIAVVATLLGAAIGASFCSCEVRLRARRREDVMAFWPFRLQSRHRSSSSPCSTGSQRDGCRQHSCSSRLRKCWLRGFARMTRSA